MGYGDYLERMRMSDGKLSVLRMIAQNENSPERSLERLDELQAIIKGRQDSTQNIAGAVEDKGNLQNMSIPVKRKDNPQSRSYALENKRKSGIPQPLIFSTIRSSKGLKYDTVYLLDVVDGVFPENMPKSLKAMDKKERAAYEEERRLFNMRNMLPVLVKG